MEIHTKYGSPRSGGPDAINVVVVCRCVCLSVTFFVSQTGSVSSLLLLDNVALGPGGVQARVLLAIRERERRPRRHFPLIRNSNFSHEVCGSLSCFHTSDESIDAM